MCEILLFLFALLWIKVIYEYVNIAIKNRKINNYTDKNSYKDIKY